MKTLEPQVHGTARELCHDGCRKKIGQCLRCDKVSCTGNRPTEALHLAHAAASRAWSNIHPV
jgi:hypothetical protein